MQNCSAGMAAAQAFFGVVGLSGDVADDAAEHPRIGRSRDLGDAVAIGLEADEPLEQPLAEKGSAAFGQVKLVDIR